MELLETRAFRWFLVIGAAAIPLLANNLPSLS